jgi:hypothetical protein
MKTYYVAQAQRIVLGRSLPTVKFFQSRHSKKQLAMTAYKFNRSQEQWLKAFLLRTNIDLKNRIF